MSFGVVDAAYKTKMGNLVAKSILVMLADASSPDGFSWPKARTISDLTEINERTVRRIIGVFQAMNLISRTTHDAERTRKGFQLNLDLLGTDLSETFTTTYNAFRSGESGPQDRNDNPETVLGTEKAVLGTTKTVLGTKPPHPLKGRTIKNHKEPPVSLTLPDWIPVPTWNDWIQMRKKIKKPATEEAMRLAVRELDKLRLAGNDPQAVLEQSIMRSWQGLFEIKPGPNGNGVVANGNGKPAATDAERVARINAQIPQPRRDSPQPGGRVPVPSH